MSGKRSIRNQPIQPIHQKAEAQPFFKSKEQQQANGLFGEAPFFPPQMKKSDGASSDPLEKEADTVANEVVQKQQGGFFTPQPFFPGKNLATPAKQENPKAPEDTRDDGNREGSENALSTSITRISSGTMQAASIQKKEGDEKPHFGFRTRYIPEMDTMSEGVLAAYCFSRVTNYSQAYFLDRIQKGTIEISGNWKVDDKTKSSGFKNFSLSKSLYYELTGYVESGDAKGGEEEELPEGPLGNGGDGKGGDGGGGAGHSFNEKRGEDNRREGAEARDEYYGTLSQEEKQAVVQEANARFYALYGIEDGYQIREDDPDFAKELWKEKRDEVLIEKIQTERLPERLRKMISDGKAQAQPEETLQYRKLTDRLSALDETELEVLDLLLHSGGKPVPLDVEQLIRLANRMQQFTSMDYMEYMSQTNGNAASMEEFVEAIDRYLIRRNEKAEEVEKMEGIKTKLYGLEGLYKAWKAFKSKERANHDMKHGIGDKFERQMDRKLLQESGFSDSAVSREREALQEQMQANGFESIAQFERFIADYEASFRQYAVRLAEDHLLRYRHQLYEEEKKLQDDAYVQLLFEQLKGSGAAEHYEKADEHASNSRAFSYQEDRFIPHHMKMKSDESQAASRERSEGKKSVETLDSPLVKEDQFEHEDFSGVASPAALKQFLLDYIQEKYESVDTAWEDLHSETDYIYDLDILYAASKESQGIADDDIFGMILGDKKQEIDSKNLAETIGILFLAVVLTIVTLGAAAPFAAVAGGAALGVSIYGVIDAAEDYKKKNAANDVGLLTEDPSLVWVVLAIAGAAFDAAALSAVFKAAKPIAEATKAFNETGDLLKLEKQLSEISELSGRIRSNILKSAEAEASANKMISGILKPQAGVLKMAILPGGEEFARLVAAAYYMAKKGALNFHSFLLKLHAEKIIDDITTLTAKEKKILKDAFEKGNVLKKADDITISQLDEAIERGDFKLIEELINSAYTKITSKEYALEYSRLVRDKGKFRKASEYHGDTMHSFSDATVLNILSDPMGIYLSKKGKYLIYHKNGDIVVVLFEASGRGNVITAYGSSGLKGTSGAKSLGGLPDDVGNYITSDAILKGEIPTSGGFFPPATQLYP